MTKENTSSNSSSKLFTPLTLGRGSHTLHLSHRISMAPMARFRTIDSHVPILPMVKDYYAQRASVRGTLLVTEATVISPRAGGYPQMPGIYSDSQIAAWREVTDAVHEKGSYIFLQMIAVGRAADTDTLRKEAGEGFDVVSSSSVPISSQDSTTPRAMTEDEIWGFIADFAQAARNAVTLAGFDGVEIHGANGYLVDQFIQDTCNRRSDSWGGSIENRARFALEVTRAVVDAVGPERTAIRFSPWSRFQGMRMEDPIPQFTYLAEQLKPFGLAYVHLVNPRIYGSGELDVSGGGHDNDDVVVNEDLDFFVKAYGNTSPVMIAGSYTPASAKRDVDNKYKDYDVIIAFGRWFTSNPDLVFRVREDVPLRKYQREFFYAPPAARGYSDFEFSGEFKTASAAA